MFYAATCFVIPLNELLQGGICDATICIAGRKCGKTNSHQIILFQFQIVQHVEALQRGMQNLSIVDIQIAVINMHISILYYP